MSTTEQRDLFFSEKLAYCPASSLKIRVAQPALVSERMVGRWTIHSCLSCGLTTHAALQFDDTVLVSKNIIASQDQLNTLKNSTNFSPVFNLLVSESTDDFEMKENIDTNNFRIITNKMSVHQAVGNLSKQLQESLQSQLEHIEESVRQYRDQKYSEFEVYKERAQRDHKILASIISKTCNAEGDSWRMDTSIDNEPSSPQLPLQRRRLSYFKDAKKITQFKSSHKSLPQEEDSLDAEDIFDLEGDSRHDMGSDQDDYDSDNSGSHDEGIHIMRGRSTKNNEIARSLPINMPFPMQRVQDDELDDNEETHDIAASIKALAKSVHGDAFELPRPRFSTQI